MTSKVCKIFSIACMTALQFWESFSLDISKINVSGANPDFYLRGLNGPKLTQESIFASLYKIYVYSNFCF